jgi:hypothetical protein
MKQRAPRTKGIDILYLPYHRVLRLVVCYKFINSRDTPYYLAMSYSCRALSQHQEPRVSQQWTTPPIGQVSIRRVCWDAINGSDGNQPDQSCESILSTFDFVYTVTLLGLMQLELLFQKAHACTTGPPSDPDRIHRARILAWCPSAPSISFNCIIITSI